MRVTRIDPQGKQEKGTKTLMQVRTMTHQERTESQALTTAESPSMTTETPAGARSEALLADIRRMEATRAELAGTVQRLTTEIAGREATLDDLRAGLLLGELPKEQLDAFTQTLDDLRVELAEAESTLAGLGARLEAKRGEIRQAVYADVQDGLVSNGQALRETQTAFIKALEQAARAAIKNAGPHRATWQELIQERRELYHQQGGRDPDRYMLADPLTKLFADDYAGPALELAEMLTPLFVVSYGWPAVRRPGR